MTAPYKQICEHVFSGEPSRDDLISQLTEYRIKHEVACSTLERVRGQRDAAQSALAAQCKHTKELEAELKRLTTAPREGREDLRCAIIDLCEQVQEARAERDELLAALNFARQGYQARFESGEAGDVEWAEMYIQSIDAAITKGEKNAQA